MKKGKNPIQNRVGFELRRLDMMMSKSLEANVKVRGIDEITLMHGWIIRYLYDNRDKDIYQKDIEKHCAIGRSTVTGIIKLMEKKGYVKREFVESDARLKKVLLTEKGIESHEAIEGMIDELNERMLVGVSKAEIENFLGMAEKIRHNIEKNKKIFSDVNEESAGIALSKEWKEEDK